MEAISWSPNFSMFNFLLKSYKVGRERRKLQEFEYLDYEESILGEIKRTLCNF